MLFDSLCSIPVTSRRILRYGALMDNFATMGYITPLLVSREISPAEAADWLLTCDRWHASWRVRLAARVNRWWYTALEG